MSEWKSTNGPGLSTPGATDDDYRLREAEVRVERRLQAMERQHSRTAWLARLSTVGLVMTIGALAFVARSALPGDGTWMVGDLSAEEIVLRDAEGVARGVMGTDAEGQAHLALSDRDGRERIRLTVLPDGSPGVTISDRDANPRAVLGYLPDGTTNLVFADPSGAIRTLVGVDAAGDPVVTTIARDSDGTPPSP